MSEAQFYTFLTGGLGLLIALMTMVAWNLWRMRDDARAGRLSALEGVSHEMRINLQRMVSELSQVSKNAGVGPDVLLPIRHPQLDGVNSSLIRANRNGIAVVGSTYQELEARKLGLRAVLAQGREPDSALDDAIDAAINGIAALYMWEVHKGARPVEAGSVRSWDVRDWMKEQGFPGEAFPGIHLRDEVVERLRMYGLTLTPRPLTHTAFEYYSMQYDRHADRSPLGFRRKRENDETEVEAEPDPEETETASEVIETRTEQPEPKRKGGLFGLFGGKKAADAEADTDDTYYADDTQPERAAEELDPPPAIIPAAAPVPAAQPAPVAAPVVAPPAPVPTSPPAAPAPPPAAVAPPPPAAIEPQPAPETPADEPPPGDDVPPRSTS